MTTNGPEADREPSLDELVVVKLWALNIAFERRLAAELAVLGISVASFRLIGELMREPEGLRQSELARRLGVRPPTVSIAVKRLEEDGLVVRGPDPDDPRARRVLLAPSASLLPGLDVLGKLEAHVVQGLDASERDQLCRQLDGLRARLSSTETES